MVCAGKTDNRIKMKIRSNAGETIAETLVALLISALALVMLAGVIAYSSRIITTSKSTLKDYYDKNDAIVEMTELKDEEENVVFSPQTGTVEVNGVEINVTYGVNDTFRNHKVISYRKTASDNNN